MPNNKNQRAGKSNVVAACLEYQGPIPPSGELQRYGEINPTFPDRIMIQFEKEAEHRRNIEADENERANKKIDAEIATQKEEVKMLHKENNTRNCVAVVGVMIGALVQVCPFILASALYFYNADAAIVNTALGLCAVVFLPRLISSISALMRKEQKSKKAK